MTAITTMNLPFGALCVSPTGDTRLGYGAPAHTALPSQVRESIPSVVVAGLAKHARKQFAMAGIDTNVWPLGPQELSG